MWAILIGFSDHSRLSHLFMFGRQTAYRARRFWCSAFSLLYHFLLRSQPDVRFMRCLVSGHARFQIGKDYYRSLGGLGSFGESSVASRRKRGPVAFRPRLWAGLALSLLSFTPSRGLVCLPDSSLNPNKFERQKCPLWVISGRSLAYHANVCFRPYADVANRYSK